MDIDLVLLGYSEYIKGDTDERHKKWIRDFLEDRGLVGFTLISPITLSPDAVFEMPPKPPPMNLMENDAGAWVPAIPLPYQLNWGRLKCGHRQVTDLFVDDVQITSECQEKFWNLDDYKKHYAYEHILMGR